jgi:hypothetical protein
VPLSSAARACWRREISASTADNMSFRFMRGIVSHSKLETVSDRVGGLRVDGDFSPKYLRAVHLSRTRASVGPAIGHNQTCLEPPPVQGTYKEAVWRLYCPFPYGAPHGHISAPNVPLTSPVPRS